MGLLTTSLPSAVSLDNLIMSNANFLTADQPRRRGKETTCSSATSERVHLKMNTRELLGLSVCLPVFTSESGRAAAGQQFISDSQLQATCAGYSTILIQCSALFINFNLCEFLSDLVTGSDLPSTCLEIPLITLLAAIELLRFLLARKSEVLRKSGIPMTGV